MNQFDLKNRTAVITGGAQGLGLGIAKQFIESGAEVIIWDIDQEIIKKAKQQLNSNKLTSQIVDVADFENVKKNIEEIIITKKVDIFINNAGITGLTSKLWNYPIDEWHKVLNVNLNGIFYCCKAIVPHMIKNNYGRIVNVASVAGKEGNANASAYSSAKAAVIGLTKSLGKELAEKNIAVNVVTPASAKTRILDQMSKEHVQFMFSKIPRKRFLEMNEFASLVTWLSSEENSFSTAAVFDISGGRSTY
jgi:3-oxoacyl-[acyl-carrier protein] reductase